MQNKEPAVQQMVRVTKPEGCICLIEPDADMIQTIKKLDPEHPVAVDPRDCVNNLPITIEIQKKPVVDVYILRKDI